MAAATAPERTVWTLADLYERFGAIPFDRIRSDPAPGSGTEDDVVRIQLREDLLYELIDGVLLRKAMGAYESLLAGVVITFLNTFVWPRGLGYVLAPDGLIRLSPGLIRISDVSFLSADRLPDGRFPHDPICPIVPDLAVEILSAGNTRKEMADKIAEYFTAGVRLVWFIDPRAKTIQIFTAPDQSRQLRESDILDGGDVLPGFELPLQRLFADPPGGGRMV